MYINKMYIRYHDRNTVAYWPNLLNVQHYLTIVWL